MLALGLGYLGVRLSVVLEDKAEHTNIDSFLLHVLSLPILSVA